MTAVCTTGFPFRPDPAQAMAPSGTIRTVVFDARCLQDPNYSGRGVGRHALALLRGAPRGTCGLRLLAVTDPVLPPLQASAREVLDDVLPNAYAGTFRHRPDIFVSLSPMTHDPLFVARLMGDARLLRCAVVYDFIPHRWAERYLPGAADRLRYATLMQWLRRCDRFMAISQSTADDACRLLGVSRADVHVTGCPLNPMFERAREFARHAPTQHILVVGGGDSRKNPEIVVRAHARSAELQHLGVRLVVAGNYSAPDAAGFRSLAHSAGGRPDLVVVPGHVSESELLRLYGAAVTIVSPSRDEGFSLPVIEGMAAGAACLVSDIPAHNELVSNRECRFGIDDEAGLAVLMERSVRDSEWRGAVLNQQSEIWPHFRSREVARRFWAALLADRETLAVPAVSRRRKPRIALLSPVPPDQSGVADYTAATCAELGKLSELDVFTETRNPPALPNATVKPLTALPHLTTEFDAVISVMGNSQFHLRIFEQLRRFGAACVAHDARMLGFYCILLGMDRAMRVASKELQRAVDQEDLNRWLSDEGRLETLFLGEVLESASPLIVHSKATLELANARYGVSPVYLPFSVQRQLAENELSRSGRVAARRRLGIGIDEVALVTFGFVHPSKAPDECIWALETLRGWGVPATLHFVGGLENMPQQGADLSALAARLGLTDSVRIANGFVTEQTWRDYLAGADVAIQLRTYGMGSISGALMDCVTAGLPTVANESLAAAVGIPSDYTRSISDALSPLLLAEAIADLLDADGKPGAKAHRIAQRQAFSEQRSFARYSRTLCEALGLDLSPAYA